MEDKTWFDLIFAMNPIIAAILGGLAGAGLSIVYSKIQARKENRSLILSIFAELVLSFERCVLYYEQANKGEVSYSSLFAFTDATILSKFASACKDPSIVAAIVTLKYDYYQIGRHVDDTAKYATQAERMAITPDDKNQLMKAARHAQGTALAFFGSSYDRILLNTELVVNSTLEITQSETAIKLAKTYRKMIDRKISVDEMLGLSKDKK